MPGSATSYLRQMVLGHTLGFLGYAMPQPAFVGLCTTAPSGTATGVEVVGGGYTRQQGAYGMVAGRNDLAANTATIEWAPATATWGVIGWFELWDALTGGNRLYWGPLVDPVDGVTPITRQILTGDIMRMSAGALIVQAI
ncbi:MAG TPA: hypothetical protein VNO55_19680 [Polyangia bacterium]|nr:hypothetical protein [Polyangia bacterium]